MLSFVGIVDAVCAVVCVKTLWRVKAYAALCLVTCFAQMVRGAGKGLLDESG
jgi:hypothetical protein